ncbi:MAG: pyridoxal-dependent decarboxylase, exosortase A system-associated [Actinomycetales bacterium]
MITQSLIERFGVDRGELTVGGSRLSRLAARVGSTPFFAYDREHIAHRIREVRQALPGAVRLSYAMKANPMPALVGFVGGLVDKIDVASAGELSVALDAGKRGPEVSFAGPGKTAHEIVQAVAAGATIEVESETEIERVVAAGAQLDLRPQIAIRVNPDFAVKGSGMRMGGGPQQFGIDAEQVPDVLTGIRGAPVDVIGFHVFAGSQNLKAEVLIESQHRIVDLVATLAEHLPYPVRYVNLGGGFGIPYSERDSPLDLPALGAGMHDVTDTLSASLPDAEPVVELGRYLVGEAGVYVTQVVDRKVSRGTTYLVVDGGLHHQLAASGNLGQVIKRNYPITTGTKVDRSTAEQVTIVGSLCTPLDVLGNHVPLPPTDIGDLIVIFQAGAYGLTASPSVFLSHLPAREVLI